MRPDDGCLITLEICSYFIFAITNICVLTYYIDFDVHVTVHHDKFLTIKPTRCTNFSNLLLEWNSTCLGQFLCPSSGVFHCTQQWYMSYSFADSLRAGSCSPAVSKPVWRRWYTISVCTVKNSWWWTKELSETCRVSFQ